MVRIAVIYAVLFMIASGAVWMKPQHTAKYHDKLLPQTNPYEVTAPLAVELQKQSAPFETAQVPQKSPDKPESVMNAEYADIETLIGMAALNVPLQPGSQSDKTPNATLEDGIKHIEFVSQQPKERLYIVQEGDTLASISETFYGSPTDYFRIIGANQNSIDVFNRLEAAQILIIPK